MAWLGSASSAARGPSTAARGTATVPDELLVPIASDVDVVTARQQGRSVAANAGFSSGDQTVIDRKSTRLNSSHSQISYAVFCLKKKKNSLIRKLTGKANARLAAERRRA